MQNYKMKKTIFAKKNKNNDYYTYFTMLKDDKGVEAWHTIKWIDCSIPKPHECPLNIIITKGSRDDKPWVNGDKSGVNKILYIGEWKVDTENPFEDHSLDGYS